jgi:hypothetical protein
VVTEYHAIDRTSPEWRELVTAGNRARLQWVNTGNSGLVSEERKAARWMRRKEKRIQKLYGKHVSPPLVRRLTLIAKADREALEKTKREKMERAATLKRVSEDSGVRELLRATPALWEMRDHFTVLSASKPVVLQYTTSPKVDTPDKAAPPPACITQAQQDRTVFDEQLEKFCRDHVIWDVKAPLPKTQTVWCEVLCRCICGANVHFLWAHSSLRTFWNRHLKKKEVDAGRLVFEVVSYPTPLPGPRRIYLTSAKIADRVCFWQVEQVGEGSRDPYVGEDHAQGRRGAGATLEVGHRIPAHGLEQGNGQGIVWSCFKLSYAVWHTRWIVSNLPLMLSAVPA